MSESVKILIEADDKASAKLAAVAKNVDRSVKSFKEAGQKTKASAEVFGALANLAGGSGLGALAGQLGQISEKSGQLAEQTHSGAAGMMAMRAGMVAIAATAGWQLGKAIGSLVLDMDNQIKKIDQMQAAFERLNAGMMANQSFQTGLKREIASSLPEYEQQRASLEKVRKEQELLIKAQQELVDKAKARTAASQQSDRFNPMVRMGLSEGEAKSDEAAQKVVTDALHAYEDTAKSIKEQLITLEAKHKQSVMNTIEAEKERLALQEAEILYGKQMVTILELQKKGVDTKTAKEIAAHEKRIAMLQRENPDLQATESRTLSSSPTNQDWMKRRNNLNTPDLQSTQSGSLQRSLGNQDWIQSRRDSGLLDQRQPQSIARELEGVLERISKMFGEEVAKGLKEQPRIAMEKV